MQIIVRYLNQLHLLNFCFGPGEKCYLQDLYLESRTWIPISEIKGDTNLIINY